MKIFINNIREIFDNKAVSYGIFNNIFSAASSLLTLPLIIIFLTPHLQGYFYIFKSLLAIQSLFLFGIGLVIQNFVSHEWAKINSPDRDNVYHISRIAGIRRFALNWYIFVALITLFVLGAGGTLFIYWSESDSYIRVIAWLPAWIVLCIVTAFNTVLALSFVFLKGTNQVLSVKQIELFKNIISRLAQWIVLAIGGSLWFFSVGAFMGLITTLSLLLKKHKSFFKKLFSYKSKGKIIWEKEIWPLQWRFATSWIAGYAKHSISIPILFAAHGPVIAGQLGMTWTMFMTLQSIAGVIVVTQMPSWAMAGANNELSLLKGMFKKSLFQSLFIFCTGGLVISILVAALSAGDNIIANRILSLLPTIVLAIGFLCENIKHTMVNLIWSQKKEPFWKLNIAEGFLAFVVFPYMGVKFGVMGLLVSFLAFSIISTLIVYIIFRSFFNITLKSD